MKKLLLTSAAIATFFSATNSYASKGSKFFLTANAGLSKTSDIQKYKSDNDMYFGLGVGYYIAPNIRMSLTFDHFFNPTHKITRPIRVITEKENAAYLELSNASDKARSLQAALLKDPNNKTLEAQTEVARSEALKLAANDKNNYLYTKFVSSPLKAMINQHVADQVASDNAPGNKALADKAKASKEAAFKLLDNYNKPDPNTPADKPDTNATYVDSVSTAKGAIDVLLLNAFIDVFEANSFKLFVGAGVGIGQVGTKITVTKQGVEDPTQSVEYKKAIGVAFAAYVGASYELVNGVNAELIYSYRDLGQAKAPEASSGQSAASQNTREKREKGFHYTGHHVGAGIRFDL